MEEFNSAYITLNTFFAIVYLVVTSIFGDRYIRIRDKKLKRWVEIVGIKQTKRKLVYQTCLIFLSFLISHVIIAYQITLTIKLLDPLLIFFVFLALAMLIFWLGGGKVFNQKRRFKKPFR